MAGDAESEAPQGEVERKGIPREGILIPGLEMDILVGIIECWRGWRGSKS